MKIPVFFAAAMVPLSACATAAEHPVAMVEDGYPRGALASAAIARGDWKTAEANLTRKVAGVAQDDPARLINLGRVYLEQGRTGEALSAWRLALASDRHEDVEIGDGRMMSTRLLAEQLLARHDGAVRSAAR